MSSLSSPTSEPLSVSIIIPAYNEEKGIRATLESLTKLQKDSDISVEIIVCDNNSTDNTISIIKEFQNVILAIENKIRGANAARQGAFRASTGTIIAALDADCIPTPDWLTNALKYFKKDPRIISVAGMYLYENNFWLAPMLNSLQASLIRGVHFISHNILGKGGIMIGGNAWYRRDALEKIGGFEVSIPFWGDDAHTAHLLSKHGKMIYAPNVQVISSSRRFTNHGPLKTQWRYVLNYFWIIITGKPYTKSLDEDVVR